MVFKRQSNRDDRRRGIILLVVLALLTLFAIVGISFVLYANAEATASRINKEAETISQPNIDPELALSMFLGQLIYDVPDNANGVYSALRGHSLARSMYGWNPGGLNDKPFTGAGKLHYAPTLQGNPILPGATGYAADDSYLVNFTYFSTDGFLRDPERYNPRSGLTDPNGPGPYASSFNVPYTYPDHQNFFLAMMRALDGQVLVPSFHRQWLFGPLADPANPTNPQNNPNWGNISGSPNTAGKYLTLRPRPIDMQVPGMPVLFPYPIDNGGDVKNLDWTVGGQDSIWIDINAPVMTAPNGQKYKMLVAPLILELDSRINLNVAGNILLGPNGYNGHTSHEGWGAFEMNISKVLNSSAAPQEWMNLILGTPSAQPTAPAAARTYGRYGNGRYPQGTALTAGTAPRIYSPVDMNSCVDPSPNSPTTYFQLPWSTPLPPTTPLTQPYQIFPTFPSGYGNGVPLETTTTGTAAGTPNHPLIYNAQRPALDNRLLPLSSLAALLRFGSTNSEAMTSDLLRLCPQNFILDATPAIGGGNATPLKRRNLVTLLSADLDRPGATPYIWDPNDQTNSTRYGQLFTPKADPISGLWSPLFPSPNPIAFPKPANPLPTSPNSTLDTSEFDPATWRSTLGQQLRINLNRPLTSYPAPYQPFTISATNARFKLTGTAASNVPYDTAISQAVADRQQLALDIFTALRKAVGAMPVPPDPNAPAQGTADYNALRWLAQLAVNVVDFIDQDDISTPFRWDPNNTNAGDYGYVFGTELPRLVINEAFIQVDNDPADPKVIAKTNASTHYNVNTWVELCNPLINEGANAPDSANQAVLQDATGSIYQIVITDPAQAPTSGSRLPNMRNPANVAGDPSYPNLGPNYGVAAGQNVMTYGSAPAVPCVVNNSNNGNTWGANAVVMPLNNAYNDATSTNKGFYVIGPPAANSLTATNLPTTTTSPAMTYWAPLETATPVGVFPMPTILLQRLACPGLPFQGDPTKANYNPYITVDYYEAFQAGQVCDSRQYLAGAAPAGTQAGLPNWAATNPPDSGIPSSSSGRNQPYAATNGVPGGNAKPAIQGQWNAQLADTNPLNPPPANQPINTFYRHNARDVNAPPNPASPSQTLKVPFDWLVHLDRQLISPMELLHVSAFKPHELTQQFYDATTGNSFSHFAPWTTQQSRLYRVFELIETASWAAGVRMGGRIPGKININMVFDQEMFEAICDAQQNGNWFNQAEVDNLFTALVKQRTPTSDGGSGFMPGAPGVPGTGDQPFWSLATGPANGSDPLDPDTSQNPPGAALKRGILNTLLRSNSAGNALAMDPFKGLAPAFDNKSLQNVPNHSYVRNQMLTKIFNNLTTRSNVFAVWLTVGFFEVAKDTNGNYVGDQYLPVKLGAEIGSAEGRPIRHRAFAIVDRTNLQAFSTTSTAAVQASTAPYANSLQTVSLGPIVPTNPNNSAPALQAGMILVYEPNTDNEETVVVQNNGGQFQAIFQRSHAANVAVINRGNPGPWLRYDPRQDTQVVPYFAIID